MNHSNKWVNRFLDLGDQVSSWSKDPTIKVGAVLVNNLDGTQYVTGFNGFPKGISDDSYRYEDKVIKHSLILHAELNAMLNARRDLINYTLYSTRFPCLHCSLATVQSGIKTIVTRIPNTTDIWKHRGEYLNTIFYLKEAQVQLVLINGTDFYSLDTLVEEITNSDERDK